MANEVEIVVTANNSRAAAAMKETAADARKMGDSVKSSVQDLGTAADKMGGEVSKLGPKLAGAGKAVALGAGAAAGAAMASGFAASLQFDSANKKMQAQLGDQGPEFAKAGQVAGNLYSSAYGDSLGEVNDAVRTVMQSGALMSDATTGDIEQITGEAMSLSQAFGVDVSDSMLAVSRMVATKMVPDAQAGLDLITKAFQKLGPGAKDVVDTFTEYRVQFQKIGVDGKEALGMVQQMMDAGARSTDLAADALKEFAIRSIDGSKSTADGFKAIGLNADDMAKKLAAGGQTSADAFQLTIDKLKGMKDPVLQSQAAVALFGTQAEDLGAALYAIDPSSAVAGLGQVAGAAETLDATIGDTAQSKITSMQRSMEQMLASFVNAPGILGDAGAAIAGFGGPALAGVSQAAVIATALPDKFKAMAVGAVTNFASMTASAVAHAAASIAGAVASAAAWIAANAAMILATGGILLAIAAVVAIVVLLIQHWDWVKAKAGEVWDWIKGAWDGIKNAVVSAVQAVIDWVKENWPTILAIMGGPIGLLIKLVIDNWDKIKAAFQAGVNAVLGAAEWIGSLPGKFWVWLTSMADAVGDRIGAIVGWFKDLPGRALNAISNFGNMLVDVGRNIVEGIWRGIQNGWDWLIDKVQNLARSLLDAAKHAIGITSPSKAFAAEVGAMIPPGIAEGIRASADVARAAIRDLTVDDLLGAGRSAVAGRSGQATAGAIGGQGGSIVLQLRTAGAPLDELLAEIIRRYVKVQGGDVQQVFGR